MEQPNNEEQLTARKLTHLRIIARFKDDLALGPFSSTNDRRVSRERRAEVWMTIKAEVEAAGADAYWAPGSLASVELFKYRNWCNWMMNAKRKYEQISGNEESRCVLNECDQFIISEIWGRDLPRQRLRPRRNLRPPRFEDGPGAVVHDDDPAIPENNAAPAVGQQNVVIADAQVNEQGRGAGDDAVIRPNTVEVGAIEIEEHVSLTNTVSGDRIPDWAQALIAEQRALSRSVNEQLAEIRQVIMGRENSSSSN